MKRWFLAAAALALLGGVATAGPNAGGTIFVHNASLRYPGGQGYSACGMGVFPASCESANTEIDGSDNARWVWKVYAAFDPCSAPRLKALDFGLRYGQFGAGGNIVLLDHGPCIGDPNNGALETPGPGWPNSGTGDALVFQFAQTTSLVEVYWFAGYSYYGGVDLFTLGPGTHGGGFADDSTPPEIDPIAGYGSLGFNRPGVPACPAAGAEGACCIGVNCTIACESDCTGMFLGPGTTCDPNLCCCPVGACCINCDCYIMIQSACESQGGYYNGDGTNCDHFICCPVPTRIESWGRIKQRYR